jgi:hypothetical protein
MNINMLHWWSLGRGSTVVPSRWQATASVLWQVLDSNQSAGFWLGAMLHKLPLTRQITAQRYSLLPASFQRVTACRRPGR